MPTIRTLKVPMDLWRACAAKADEVGLPTVTWMLRVLARAADFSNSLSK